MALLLLHEHVDFEDQTVYLTGNAYHHCSFSRCTLVYMGGPGDLNDCQFHSCVWHVNVLFFEAEQWKAFVKMAEEAMVPSLLTLPPEQSAQSEVQPKPEEPPSEKDVPG